MPVRSGRTRTAVAARFPGVELTTLVADFTTELALPPLDGLVAANSLHFVPRDRQVAVIRSLATHLRPGAPFIVVEYDADRGNPWVPHPFTATTFARLAAEAGLVDTTPLDPRPEPVPRRDLLGGEPPAERRDQPLDVVGLDVALRRHAHEDGPRWIGRGRAGTRHRPGHDRDLDPVVHEAEVEGLRLRVRRQAREAAPTTIDPISPSGAGIGPPSAATSRSRASSASA